MVELIVQGTLYSCFTPDTVKNPEDCSAWLSKGITYYCLKLLTHLKQKNYRTITCLSTTSTLLASITQRVCMHSWRKMIYSLLNKKAKEDSMAAKING